MTCMHPPPYGTDTVVLRLHRRFPIGQIEQIKSWTPQQVGGGKKKKERGKNAYHILHYLFFIYILFHLSIYLSILLFT